MHNLSRSAPRGCATSSILKLWNFTQDSIPDVMENIWSQLLCPQVLLGVSDEQKELVRTTILLQFTLSIQILD